MSKLMRVLVFFDLPVTQPAQRREAARFRKKLLDAGYFMLQFSVYSRIVTSPDAVETQRRQLKAILPPEGCVRILPVTEKQYESMEILLGKPTPHDRPASEDVLSIY